MTVPHYPPDDVETSLALGMALRQSGNLAEAEETCRAVLRGQPRHAEALYLLGLLHGDRNDRREAVALIRTAVSTDAAAARHHIDLGRLLALDGDLAAADSFKRALTLEPSNLDALTRLGALRIWEKRIAEAAEIFDRAMTLAPEDPTALHHVAGLYLTIGNPQAAEWCARRALSGNDGVAEAHVALGHALSAQDRHREAAEAYGRAVALRPRSLDARLELASALEADGCRDEAARHLRAAVEERSQDADALLRIGGLLFDQGHEAEALAVYRRFAALTTERDRFPGCLPRSVAVRPAANACRDHGWPYHTVAPSTPVRVTDGEGTPYTYDVPEAFLAFTEDAVIVPRVHAPLVGGHTLLIDGFSTNSRGSLTLVPHLVWHSRDERMLIDLPEPAHTIEEEAILLGGGANWSHGVLDWSSKLAVLECFPELARLPVLVSADTLRSIRDLLELLGLERSRMEMLTPGEVVRARRLWLPSLTHAYQYTSPLHVEFLHRRLAGPIEEGRSRPRRRIFLSRRHAGYRALVNEAEVLAALAPLGVEPVVPEDFPMAEQIALFASAELIVGPIGGGSAAIIFAPPGAAYVELVHSRIALPQYGLLTALLGQRYRQIVGEAGGNRSKYAFDHDFTVPPAEVAAAARLLLDGA